MTRRREPASLTPPTQPVPPALSDELPEGFKMTELGPLPEEWEVVKLGEVATVGPSRIPRQSRDVLPFIPMSLIPEGGGEISQYELRAPSDVRSGVVVSEGDLLLAKITPCLENEKQGIVKNIPGGWGYATTEVFPLRANDRLEIEFLNYYLLQPSVREALASKMEGTTGRQRLPRAVVVSLPMFLPSVREQRAIAHVLRTVQRAKEAMEGVIAALKELKKSLMQHLFTYGPVPVTERERVPLQETEIGPLPAHWRVVRLGEVVDVKGGKRLPKGDEFASNPTPYPYIRIVDFKNGSVDIRNLKFLTEEQHIRLNRYIITSNDVYISIAGTIGLVGSVPEELNGAHLTENAARLILNTNRLYRQFLVVALQSDMVQAQIQARATKTSQPKLALARIKEIPIPLPPLDEQREIARMLQAVDAKIAAEQARRAALEELFKTVLHILMTAKLRVPYEGARHA